MQLNDALFNWLQIELVREARPSDRSAKETVLFFEELLREDHQVASITKKLVEDQYHVEYVIADEPKTVAFPCKLAQKLLQDILEEPRYNQSFDAD